MIFEWGMVEPDTQYGDNKGRDTDPHQFVGENFWYEVNSLSSGTRFALSRRYFLLVAEDCERE